MYLPMELTVKSQVFWHALISLLDDIRHKPNLPELRIFPCSINLDKEYSLRGNHKRIWLVDRSSGKIFCMQPHDQKDNFPYTKLLDAYIKRSVISKLSNSKKGEPHE